MKKSMGIFYLRCAMQGILCFAAVFAVAALLSAGWRVSLIVAAIFAAFHAIVVKPLLILLVYPAYAYYSIRKAGGDVPRSLRRKIKMASLAEEDVDDIYNCLSPERLKSKSYIIGSAAAFCILSCIFYFSNLAGLAEAVIAALIVVGYGGVYLEWEYYDAVRSYFRAKARDNHAGNRGGFKS